MVTLKAKPDASSRTKNRIREHGPKFILVRRDKFRGADALLVRSNKNIRDAWFGWLPLGEISEITET